MASRPPGAPNPAYGLQETCPVYWHCLGKPGQQAWEGAGPLNVCPPDMVLALLWLTRVTWASPDPF